MNDRTKKNLEAVGFGEEVRRIHQKACPLCGTKVDKESLRDELSKREHKISGMCQKCQDRIFE